MKRSQITFDSRLAGQVDRYHTWPHLRPQSVGEHTWQNMRIWFQIWGPLPPDVTTYFIWHDAGEVYVGDNPFPVKQNDPILKEKLDGMETHALTQMGVTLPELSPEDKVRAKICDLIDMHEFGANEEQLGNKYAHPIVVDTLVTVDKLLTKLPFEDGNKVRAYLYKRKGQLECTL